MYLKSYSNYMYLDIAENTILKQKQFLYVHVHLCTLNQNGI